MKPITYTLAFTSLVLKVGLCLAAPSDASQTADSDEFFVSQKLPTAYCGLQCAYATAKLHGKHIDFKELVKPENLTGPYGSSIEDLLRLLKENNLHSEYHTHLSIERLKSIQSPVILHTRPPAIRNKYSHWILFLGFDEGEIRIYDPPYDEGKITVAELLSIWDGSAIEVHGEEQPVASLGLLNSFFSIQNILSIILAISLLNLFSHRLSKPCSLIVASLVMASVTHFILPDGFYSNRQAVRNVQSPFFPETVKSISYERLQELVLTKKAILVDARPQSAFMRDHLHGAINLSIDSSYLKILATLPKLAEKDYIIFYCQSNRCGWAADVACLVKSHGVNNVFVFDGGVYEWQARHNNDEK